MYKVHVKDSMRSDNCLNIRDFKSFECSKQLLLRVFSLLNHHDEERKCGGNKRSRIESFYEQLQETADELRKKRTRIIIMGD